MPGLSLGLGIGLTRQRRALSPAERLLSSLGLLDRPNIAAVDWRYQSIVVHRGGVRTFNGDVNDFFENTAPPTQYIRNSSGFYVPGTTLRTHHDADGNPLGLLVEEQRTSVVRNSACVGAVAGVLGSGGSLPTTWTYAGPGLTYEVIGTAVENGVDCVDIRISGTPSSTYAAIFPEPLTAAASNGQVWSSNIFLKIAGGGLTNVLSTRMFMRMRDSGSSSIGNIVSTIAPTSTLTRFKYTDALNQAATASVIAFFQLDLTAGQAIDITLRVGWPQFELGGSVTSPIRSTGSQVTRAANDITLPLSLIPWDPTQGTFVVEVGPSAGDVTRHILNVSSDGDGSGHQITYASNGSPIYNLVDEDGNIDTLNLSNGVGTKFALAFAKNDVALSTDGAAVATSSTADPLPTSPDKLYIGQSRAGATQLNSYIKSIVYIPERLTNAELQALSA